ncbi:MAG: hypothetical protein AAF963_02690 [Bacteroidota bacterium]
MLYMIIKKHFFPHQRLFVFALGAFLALQTACMNEHRLGLDTKGFTSSSRSNNSRADDDEVSFLSKNIRSIRNKSAATYLFNAVKDASIDEKVVEELQENCAMSTNTKKYCYECIINSSQSNKQVKKLANEAMRELDLDLESKESSDNTSGEERSSSEEEYQSKIASNKEDGTEKLADKIQFIFDGPSEKLENRQVELKNLYTNKQKVSDQAFITAIIKAIEGAELSHSFNNVDSTTTEPSVGDAYKLLQNMCNPGLISGQAFLKGVIDYYTTDSMMISDMFQGLHQEKVVSLPDILQTILAHKRIAKDEKLKLLKRILQSGYYKSACSTLKANGEASKILHAILNTRFAVQEEYDLLKWVHKRQAASLLTILEVIIQNETCKHDYKQDLLQHIFLKSKYFKNSIAALGEEAVPTLQQIVQNYFDEQATLAWQQKLS